MECRINRVRTSPNIEPFKAHYGSNPTVGALIWQNLQETELKAAWVPPSKRNLKHFCMALHHLKRYPVEIEREAIFDISLVYGRDCVWYFIKKVQALKRLKITWPDDCDDIWVLTVDGTQRWSREPQHATWSMDSDYYSHKYGKAGINYELGISLKESRLIWMNGPFPAGKNDVTIFANEGLKEKLRSAAQIK
jgi:hypothetical protein